MTRTATQKIKHLIALGTSGGLAFSVIAFYKNDERFFSNYLLPALHKSFSGESAHNLAVWAIGKKMFRPITIPEEDLKLLQTSCFGLTFNNPVGMAAGFDKNALALDGYSDLGFGSVEVGSVTPLPQPGNARPRVFRLPKDQGIINRYGFNNDGHEVVYERLKRFSSGDSPERLLVVGVNLGKNKTSENAEKDYAEGVRKFAAVADYLVINVSSPNTPGLRSLQGKSRLEKLISSILNARKDAGSKTPILLKIAPDLSSEDMIDIAEVVLKDECKIDGLIISNTTVSRPASLLSSNKDEIGGLSGKPLKDLSTHVIKKMYTLTQGKIPIIGVGGVSNGEDAFEKIEAGASLIQIYSSFVYQGPPVVKKINRELAQILRDNNICSLSQIVGRKANN